MNQVNMTGRLTADPEVRYTKSGSQIANYRIAVNRRFKREGEPDADFINCTVFGKGAEFAGKYLKKGTGVGITGRLQTDSYTNKDGFRVNTFEIIVDTQEFTESKKREEAPDGFMDIPDDVNEEIPFL